MIEPIKTYCGITFVGWSLLIGMTFCLVCWLLIVMYGIAPAIRAVVG